MRAMLWHGKPADGGAYLLEPCNAEDFYCVVSLEATLSMTLSNKGTRSEAQGEVHKELVVPQLLDATMQYKDGW